jgi:hypothetical protein
MQFWIPNCAGRFQGSFRRGDFGGIKFQLWIIRERLSHECRRRRVMGRNGRILRVRRCSASD